MRNAVPAADPAGGEDPAGAEDGASAVAEQVQAAVREELDRVIPHVVAALKRDRAFDALQERLQDAERRLDARRDSPVAIALLGFVHRLRHLDFDPAVRSSLDAEIVQILRQAGFEESGSVGERFDPGRHEPIAGRTMDGLGWVAEVHATGLTSYDGIVVRARVGVSATEEFHPHKEI